MNKVLVLIFTIMGAGLSASAAMTNDAILGNGDTFACDAFAGSAKVACMPGVSSSYRGRTSFPDQPALIIYSNQVVECRNVGGKRDVICNADVYNGGPGMAPMPPAPVETRKAYSYPDYRCLEGLPSVTNADDMVSNAFIRDRRVVDRCDSSRDLSEIRRMEGRGFSCTIDTTARNQSHAACVENLLSKITSKNTIKNSHRRLLENQYCATQTYNCVR